MVLAWNGMLQPTYGDYHVDHPLDWWARGGLEAVCRGYAKLEPEKDWSYPHAKRRAYKRVHGMLNRYYKRTGDPIWKPVGHKQHEQLKEKILRFKTTNHDLV